MVKKEIVFMSIENGKMLIIINDEFYKICNIYNDKNICFMKLNDS